MATFDFNLARTVALDVAQGVDEESLSQSFAEICRYLSEFPDSLSWRSKDKPSVVHSEGLQRLAQRYFQGYRRSDFPALPSTVPDPMVSIILREVHGYSDEDCARITLEHQQAMCAENCVGALLERYLDSVLRRKGWHWCVGDFVRAIDFVRVDDNDQWQTAILGVVTVTNDKAHANEMLSKVVNFIESDGEARLENYQMTFY